MTGRRAVQGWWRQVILGVFLFAAVATPTGDPCTMTALAVPMLVPRDRCVAMPDLAALDDRRAVDGIDSTTTTCDDDEASPLDDRPAPLDDGPGSRLDDDDIT